MFNKKPLKVLVSIFAAYGALNVTFTVARVVTKIRFKHLSPEKKFDAILKRPGVKALLDEARRSCEVSIIKPFITERLNSGYSNDEIITDYNNYILEVGSAYAPTILQGVISAAGLEEGEDAAYFTTRFMGMIFPDVREYLPTVS